MSIVINFTDNEHIKLILFNIGDEPISLNDNNIFWTGNKYCRPKWGELNQSKWRFQLL